MEVEQKAFLVGFRCILCNKLELRGGVRDEIEAMMIEGLLHIHHRNRCVPNVRALILRANANRGELNHDSA
jgi:hypothetical protein